MAGVSVAGVSFTPPAGVAELTVELTPEPLGGIVVGCGSSVLEHAPSSAPITRRVASRGRCRWFVALLTFMGLLRASSQEQ
jgi:hypothetical protein